MGYTVEIQSDTNPTPDGEASLAEGGGLKRDLESSEDLVGEERERERERGRERGGERERLRFG
jgi:hypothetical protein